MKKTFVEYKVKQEELVPYRAYMAEVQQRYPAMEWLESKEQPGLFLEIHTDEGLSLAERRRADPALRRWTKDGAVQIWIFRDARQQTYRG